MVQDCVLQLGEKIRGTLNAGEEAGLSCIELDI